MKKLLIGLMALILCLSGIVVSDAQAPRSIIGTSGECDHVVYSGCTAIPLTLGLLCDGAAGELDCPQYFALDATDTTGSRFYGLNSGSAAQPRCVQSVDIGFTWTQCPSQPYTTADASTQAYFGLSRTGAIMIATNTAANTCEIRRSTDGGINWSTVYTNNTTTTCNNTLSATGNMMYCDEESDYCLMLAYLTTNLLDRIPLESLDNGANWTPGLTIVLGGFNGAQSIISIAHEDTTGVAVGTVMRSTAHAASRSGGSFVIGSAWTGFTPGDSSSPGNSALLMGGTFFCVCGQIANGASSPLTLRQGVDGTITKSFFMPEMGYRENGPFFISISPRSNLAYVMSLRKGTSQYAVWVTQDGFTTNPLKIGQITPTNVYAGCCNGEIHYYGGKIYFTSGGVGGNAQFMRVS